MRNTIVLVSSLAVFAAAPAAFTALPLADADTPVLVSGTVFVVAGGGFGHGVGLNQYGALSQARAGRGYKDILAFYYPGTTIVGATVSTVRVLISDRRKAVVMGSTGPFTVRDGAGTVTRLPAGESTFRPDLTIVAGGAEIALQAPLSFAPAKGSTMTVDGKGYRGTLRADVVEGALRVINTVGLDGYLRGVISGEMPRDWPAEALQAQAVAARSYALAGLVANRPFDLYADVRSQVYGGVAAESPETNAAVSATSGQVLMYGGKVATAYYSASSGGQTASSADAFGVAIPYLVARPDPWDGASPFHRWPSRSYTADSLAKAFGLSAPVEDIAVVPTPSGRPASVTLVKASGVRVRLKAADVRARLRLLSTAFRLGVLRFDGAPRSEDPGSAVLLTGTTRDVDSPTLEKLAVDGRWLPTSRLAPGPDGAFSVTVAPKTTATYRLIAAGQIGPALTVAVAGTG